jgi:DNA-binding beta-propeller fold protein YncE
VATRPDGALLLVDALNFRIVELGPDGAPRASFGQAGGGEGAFGRPKGVAVGDDGRVYVTDAQHDVLLVFDAGGKFELAVGRTGNGPDGLALPAGVAVGGGFVFVADSYNRRVQIYELLGGAP